MSKPGVIITDSNSFKGIISDFENSLSRVKDIFDRENSHIETINKTDVWTGATQEVMYEKNKELAKNFVPIENSLQRMINYMKNTVESYEEFERTTDNSMNDNSTNLDVNS